MRIRLGWHIAGCAVAVLCQAATALAAPAPPTASVPLTSTPPKVDGHLDDACWAAAYVSPTFYDFELKRDVYRPNADTVLRLTTDGKWLYFGLACTHPTPNDMKASIHENFGGHVFGDECVKFFLNPGLDGVQHIRYVLNCANVYTMRRSFSGAPSTPNVAWPSATQVTDTGWSAEVAVPLFYLAGYGELRKLRLNVFRKKIIKEYDEHQVEVGFQEAISCWCPTDEWLNLDEMGRLDGLDALKIETAFVANAEGVTAGSVYTDAGRNWYDTTLTLKSLTAHSGTVQVEVVETPLDGAERRASESFALAAHEVRQAKVRVPFDAPGERSLTVVLRDAADGMPFQTITVKDTSGFQLLSGHTRLNYYTSERTAEVLYTLGLPAQALRGKRLVIRAETGATLARAAEPAPQGRLVLPLAALANGQHTLTLALTGAEGNTLFTQQLDLTKLPPKPGCEWKIDRLTGGLLDNGKPFFPFGFLVSDDDRQNAEIAQAGFNTVVWWLRNTTGPAPLREMALLAQKHGLKLMVRPQMVESQAERMQSLKEHFTGEEYKQAVYGARAMVRLKGAFGGAPFTRLTREQRNGIFSEFMDLQLPEILGNVRSVVDMPNLIGYNTMDEPNFVYADLDRELRRMYLKIKEVDPYRPVFLLYSSGIPPGPRATSFADCLGTDPYWTPGRTLPRGSINWMSQTTAITVARAMAVGQCPWTIPQSSLWSDVIKRMLTGPEVTCQTYLALIHRTKAILYFTHGLVHSREQWEALKELAVHVRELTPALLAPEPPQQISYKPGSWEPLKGVLPDVQARLLRYPGGRHVLLAANVRQSPVDVQVRVTGLEDEVVRGLFSGVECPVTDGTFSDALQARGVRAYAVERVPADGPVRIQVEITPRGKEGTVETGYRSEGRKGHRNIKPNPSFEEATVPGWPDYLNPQSFRQGWINRIGTPDAPLAWSEHKPYHGQRCVFVNNHLFYMRCVPQHAEAQSYVFSFYARTEAPEPVRFRIWGLGLKRRTYLDVDSSEWKRYHLVLSVPPKANDHSLIFVQAYGPAYVDAIQLEKGLEPTPFEP